MHSLQIICFLYSTERIDEREIKAPTAASKAHQPHLRVRGLFLSENFAMPQGQQVKIHKSASFVDILEVC